MSSRMFFCSPLRGLFPILGFIVMGAWIQPGLDAQVNFARDVLPILSDKCFVCHGPDGEKESELRLDSFQGATADLGGYRALVPKNPDKSELIQRIFDPDNPMPPEDADKPITESEREVLKKWVQQGGEYQRHWAYEPPRKQPGSIDDWIQAQFPPGVGFAPEAERTVLARRVALILTGLPPEPIQLEEFLNDKSADAYAKFVDRMLESPRYGEHQARYWLDAVRYGDTHGLHLDNRRGIYPYRDWVIRSFNANQPFDEFIRWQLAGDLLPDSTLEQQVATGYIRMNPTTSEGGVIPAEFQAKNNFDRVETLGTVLLGASLVCARCHTHKYDPITQTEYFQLLAFFNSTSESPLDGNAYAYGPVAKVPADIGAWRKWERLNQEISQFLSLAKPSATLVQKRVDEHAKWQLGNWQWSPALNPDAPVTNWTPVSGLPGTKGNLPNPNQVRWVEFVVETDRKVRLRLDFNRGPGSQLWVGEQPVAIAKGSQSVEFLAGKTRVRLKLGGERRVSLRIKVIDPLKALVLGSKFHELDLASQLELLADSRLGFVDSEKQKQAESLTRRRQLQLQKFTTTLVAKERSKPRVTRRLERGEYDLPVGDPLEPAVPEVMGRFGNELPANRLGLSSWLTSNDHPLVARVLVNRFWNQVFGHGLVRTPEDFGLQGSYPTHPELLDGLAVDFRASGWNLKGLLKRMLMSRTFRQKSRWRRDVQDPENRLFARGPGFRLDAEVIRDIALWSSGMLDPHMGGEGVKPAQPAGMWKALMHPASNTKNYVADQDGRQYRRSIYVYWKRTSPHPMMTLFDAPNRESSCVRRSRSTTPLQSLALLNESQRVEAARALAKKLVDEHADDQQRLGKLFGLLASRQPSSEESRICLELLQRMKVRYTQSQEDAAVVSGLAKPDEAALVAAWSQVAITVMASDAALRVY